MALILYGKGENELADRFVAEFWRKEPTTQAAFEHLARRYVLATWKDGEQG